MIQLPNNITVAVLGAAVGLGLGLVAGWALWDSDRQPAPYSGLNSWEEVLRVDRDRAITKEDTSGQEEEPDLKIHYDTVEVTETDTVEVPVPKELGETPAVSSRSPLNVDPGRVTWTYFDTKEQRYEQQVYAVPVDRYRFSLYAVLRRSWESNLRPLHTSGGLGAQAHLNPKLIPGALEPFAEVRTDFTEVVYTGGIRWLFLR